MMWFMSPFVMSSMVDSCSLGTDLLVNLPEDQLPDLSISDSVQSTETESIDLQEPTETDLSEFLSTETDLQEPIETDLGSDSTATSLNTDLNVITFLLFWDSY